MGVLSVTKNMETTEKFVKVS